MIKPTLVSHLSKIKLKIKTIKSTIRIGQQYLALIIVLLENKTNNNLDLIQYYHKPKLKKKFSFIFTGGGSVGKTKGRRSLHKSNTPYVQHAAALSIIIYVLVFFS